MRNVQTTGNRSIVMAQVQQVKKGVLPATGAPRRISHRGKRWSLLRHPDTMTTHFAAEGRAHNAMGPGTEHDEALIVKWDTPIGDGFSVYVR